MQHQFLEPEPSAHKSAISYPETQMEGETATEQDTFQYTFAEQAQTQAVTDLLATTQHKIRRRKIKFWGAFAVCEGTIFLVLLPLIAFLRHSSIALPFIGACLMVSLAALCAMLRIMHSPFDFDQEELARVGGVRAIGPLLGALTSGKGMGGQVEVYAALTRLLPQMRATDANLLLARHRARLNALLKAEQWPAWWVSIQSEVSLPLAILKAYEQVGDAKAIPVVEKLSNMRARTPRQRAVKQAAMDCLPLLQSHVMPLDQNLTLLRAASQSKAAADVLLRPAVETVSVPAEELLRAANNSSNDQQGHD